MRPISSILAGLLCSLPVLLSAGVAITGRSPVPYPFEEPEPRPMSVDIEQAQRSQSGIINRQSLSVGSDRGQVKVKTLIQRQTGIGNRQSMSLGTDAP